MKKNAIILAAGKSTRFAPLIYERPKGLFCVKGEVLIERQIEQLQAADVQEIYVVVGYMKEKFFYLEEKYGVKLLVNNTFAAKGNLYSLYVAREHLADTFICCADHYFTENPFIDDNTANVSYRACEYKEGKFREFAIDYSDANVITGFAVGGKDNVAMIGHAYFNAGFSRLFRQLLENEINDFGVNNLFWEEFYAKHQRELTLYARRYDGQGMLEFESIDELRRYDTEFLANIDSNIISNICAVLQCNPNSILKIKVIQAGLTNVSFAFTVDGVQYVYRHPGSTAGCLVDRQAELFAQTRARELGVDKSVIYMDLSGWKISYFVQNMVECSFAKYPEQLMQAMDYLRRMHSVQVNKNIKIFDIIQEGKKLMQIASASKGNLEDEFAVLISKVERLDKYVRAEDYPKVLCHNDVYEPNYLATAEGDLYLIDWEYAGLNDAANDVASILCRGDFSDDEVEHYLRMYMGRELTVAERRHYIAYIALCGFYWFCWGLYKGSVGDDDGFFFLPAYRNCLRFIDDALASYEVEIVE